MCSKYTTPRLSVARCAARKGYLGRWLRLRGSWRTSPHDSGHVFHFRLDGQDLHCNCGDAASSSESNSLDDPIGKYLGRLNQQLLGRSSHHYPDFLTHRSGLEPPMPAGCELEKPPKPLAAYIRDTTLEHTLRATTFIQPLWSAKVGRTFQYSNLGIATLSYLVGSPTRSI